MIDIVKLTAKLGSLDRRPVGFLPAPVARRGRGPTLAGGLTDVSWTGRYPQSLAWGVWGGAAGAPGGAAGRPNVLAGPGVIFLPFTVGRAADRPFCA